MYPVLISNPQLSMILNSDCFTNRATRPRAACKLSEETKMLTGFIPNVAMSCVVNVQFTLQLDMLWNNWFVNSEHKYAVL